MRTQKIIVQVGFHVVQTFFFFVVELRKCRPGLRRPLRPHPFHCVLCVKILAVKTSAAAGEITSSHPLALSERPPTH